MTSAADAIPAGPVRAAGTMILSKAEGLESVFGCKYFGSGRLQPGSVHFPLLAVDLHWSLRRDKLK